MTDAWQPPSNGALDDSPWPDRLIGRACEPAASDDRLFGYAVLGDVARNYTYADLLCLAIVGELPEPPASQRFAAALCACAAVSVAEAPTHAAVLARISGSDFTSAIAAGIVIAADRARKIVNDPDATPADPAWLASLSAAAGIELDPQQSRHAAVVSVFRAAGLTRPEQIEAAIISAQTVGITAEALQTGPQHLPQYPVKLPEYRYVEGRDSTEGDTEVVRRK